MEPAKLIEISCLFKSGGVVIVRIEKTGIVMYKLWAGANRLKMTFGLAECLK
jgi:hypothetical protein